MSDAYIELMVFILYSKVILRAAVRSYRGQSPFTLFSSQELDCIFFPPTL
jgi:hypothetical protein